MENENLLRDRRKELGLSQATVGKAIGVSQQHVDRFEKGYPVPMSKISALAAVLQIDKTLLLPKDLLPSHMSGVDMVTERLTRLFTKKDEVTIEMIDATACCGDGIDNLPEKVCGYWNLPTAEFKSITSGKPENIKMLRVQGDSMHPTINEGDFVWVDISNNFISSDGIYLIRMATGLAIKRLQSGLSDIVIKSDNSSYSDITASVGEIQIIGKVIYILNGRRV